MTGGKEAEAIKTASAERMKDITIPLVKEIIDESFEIPSHPIHSLPLAGIWFTGHVILVRDAGRGIFTCNIFVDR
jgi:hypothetical protein